MIYEICPPNRVRPNHDTHTVFFAGAIDNGAAVNWQQEALTLLREYRTTVYNTEGHTVWVYNPRRPDWNADLDTSADNPMFAEQVEWELDFISSAESGADTVLMVFPASAKAPITLLELGIMVTKFPERLVVVVEDGYWRRGNIEIVCRRAGIPVYTNLSHGLTAVARRIRAGKS